MASWQAKMARSAIGKVLGSPDDPIEEQRAALDRMGKLPRPRGARAEEIYLGGVRCLQITPTRSVTERHLIYLHGGAYAMGSPETHAGWVQWMAMRANAVVTLVDYRLAPEHTYPAAIDDCVAAVRGLYETVDSSEVTIGGDSAGGGATLATLCRLRDAGDALPVGAVLFSPWTDLTGSGDSVQTRNGVDPMINAEWLAPFADAYRGAMPANDPGVSPLFANLSGLPPTLIQVGDHEVLLDDSVRLAEAMRAAGVTVKLEIEPEMWHVYQAVAFLPEARAALTSAAHFLSDATRGRTVTDLTDQPTTAHSQH